MTQLTFIFQLRKESYYVSMRHTANTRVPRVNGLKGLAHGGLGPRMPERCTRSADTAPTWQPCGRPSSTPAVVVGEEVRHLATGRQSGKWRSAARWSLAQEGKGRLTEQPTARKAVCGAWR